MRSVGKGMTVLSADKDYQKKRQKSLARQTDSMREGFARAGRRLVLVSITTRLSLPLDFTIYDTHTHTHPFNGSLSRTTQVSRYQKGKTNLDITEARDSEWQWHQLGHMQVCTSLQTDNHASTPPLSFFTGRMSFLPPKKQC